MRKAALLLSVLAVAPAQAASYFMNGPHLIEFMREYDKVAAGTHPVNRENAYEFQKYVAGVYDAYSALGMDGILICTPSNMELGQIGAVVSNHLKKVPEQWHRPAALLVSEALEKAFPCPKSKKGGNR